MGQRDQKHHSLHCARRCMLALQVWIMVLKSRTGSPPGRYVSNCPYDIVISKASGKERKKKPPRKHNQKTTPTEKDKTSYLSVKPRSLPTPPQLRTRIRQARPFLSPYPSFSRRRTSRSLKQDSSPPPSPRRRSRKR